MAESKYSQVTFISQKSTFPQQISISTTTESCHIHYSDAFTVSLLPSLIYSSCFYFLILSFGVQLVSVKFTLSAAVSCNKPTRTMRDYALMAA